LIDITGYGTSRGAAEYFRSFLLRCPDWVQLAVSEFQLFMTTNRCPQCRRRIYRTSGCEHMTCPQPCGALFKWCDRQLSVLTIAAFALTSRAMYYVNHSMVFPLPEAYWAAALPLFTAQCALSAALQDTEARVSSNPYINRPICFLAIGISISTPIAAMIKGGIWLPATLASNACARMGTYYSLLLWLGGKLVSIYHHEHCSMSEAMLQIPWIWCAALGRPMHISYRLFPFSFKFAK
jgi:hypothetical protein